MFLPVLLIRKKLIIKKLSQCGAFTEETAKTLEKAGVFNPNAFPKLNEKLVKDNVLAITKDNKYYLV